MVLDVPRQSIVSARSPRPNEIWAVVLAAGDSERMGRSKALHPLRRETFLSQIVRLYLDQGVPVCIVLGAAVGEAVRSDCLREARVLHNPEPSLGPLSSLRLALEAIRPVAAWMVHPVDHPLVAPGSVHRLQTVHRRHPGCILIPTCGGRKGHPVLFPQRLKPDLGVAPLEKGARWAVHRNRASTIRVETGDEGILANLNTPQLVRHWCRRLSSRL